jgi:integral membrane sensor domain MASE1
VFAFGFVFVFGFVLVFAFALASDESESEDESEHESDRLSYSILTTVCPTPSAPSLAETLTMTVNVATRS